MIKELTNNNFDREVRSGEPMVAEFYSPTCVHCKRLERSLKELAEEFSGAAVIGKCNITEEPALVSIYDITSVPTLLFIRGGEVRERLTGEIHKLVLAENIKKLIRSV